MTILEGNSHGKDGEVFLDLYCQGQLSILRWSSTTLVDGRNILDEIPACIRIRVLEKLLVSGGLLLLIPGIRCSIVSPRESHIQGARRFAFDLEMERCYARRYER